MKVLHIAESTRPGGAGIAADRIYQSTVRSGVDASLYCHRNTHDSMLRSAYTKGRSFLGQAILRLQLSDDSTYRSIAVLPSGISRNKMVRDASILHLHWTQGEFLSIEDIGGLKAPLVWTLHDSWPICGAEHHPNGSDYKRIISGYTVRNRSYSSRGVDLDRWVWLRKAASYPRYGYAVAPSSWLSKLARSSYLLKNWDISHIPNPIDIDMYRPRGIRELTRKRLGIDEHAFVLFSSSASKDLHDTKGIKRLISMCTRLEDSGRHVVIITCGHGKVECKALTQGVTHRHLGYIKDEIRMSEIYECSDVYVSLSSIESFGLSMAEAQACGVPVIGMRSAGTLDVVDEGNTGLLLDITAADSDIILQIQRLIADNKLRSYLSGNARIHACKEWSFEAIGKRYSDLYMKVRREFSLS